MKVVATFCRDGNIVASIKSDADIDPYIVNDDKLEMRKVMSTMRSMAYGHVGHRFVISIYKVGSGILLEREMNPHKDTLWVEAEMREAQFNNIVRLA